MKTLTPIRKRSTRVELTQRELEMMNNFLFAGLVRTMQDANAYDPQIPEDDAFRFELNMDADIIRGMQRKMEFALKQIEMDGNQ